MATETVHIPLPPIADQLDQSTSTDIMAEYAQRAIALCVDAIMFSHGDGNSWLQQRYGQNWVKIWQTLVQSFEHWYKQRPLDFQPVIQLYPKDGVRSEDDFPMIVFTNGAALLANQLYHTGMLLLLQSKPRFASKSSSSSASVSTLWHAHRICGIANQNDSPASWDPCLVASLIVASRTVSHSSQHIAVLQTLGKVQRLTGWRVESLVDELEGEWQLAGA
jgi:hypothetical protein